MNKRKNKLNNTDEINCVLKNFKFKSINLTISKQIVILGSILGFISLYLPWIKDLNKLIDWSAFNSLTGNIGYLLLIILALPIFVSLSTGYKQKIKLYSDLSLKNHFIIITSAIFIISFSIITLSFVNGLHTFFESITYGKGVILCMTSGIMILLGGLMIRKEYYANNSEIILNKLNQNREMIKKEDNMKLPF